MSCYFLKALWLIMEIQVLTELLMSARIMQGLLF